MLRISRVVAIVALALISQQATAGPVNIFSDSPLYRTPETISPAPDGFGTLGGTFFIPDFNRGQGDGNIWVVPAAGGPPASFAVNPDIVSRGGLFLPAAGWGDNSGRFLETGAVVDGTVTGSRIYTFAPDGSRTLFAEVLNTSFYVPRIAPADFGSFAGQLVVASTSSTVFAIDPNGTTSTVATTPFLDPFGLAFAPSGFGALGGHLFASDTAGGQVVSIAPDGTVSPFATIPLQAGQLGLRQMEFSPDGFLPGYGKLLFVSVTGSAQGGGTLGDVVALDSSGRMVASLRTDLGLEKFDPRGLYFIDSQNLLVSDASDPILLMTPGGFQAVPEPSTIVLLSFGLGALVLFSKRIA